MNNNSRRNPKKFLTLVICLNLVVMLVVGGTLAYIFTSSDTVVNTFQPVIPSIEVDEPGWDNVVKQNVTIKNTGEVESYIRVKVVVTWKNDAAIYSIDPIEGTDYSLEYITEVTPAVSTDWEKGNDGFWYYKKSVLPGASTGTLIKSATWLKPCVDSNYKLSIEILSQAIQSTPDEAVESVWPVSAEKGMLTVNN